MMPVDFYQPTMVFQHNLQKLLRFILRRFIHFHPLTSRNYHDMGLWDYDIFSGWMENMDYVLSLADEDTNEYERLEKRLIEAEYAVCRELSILGGVIIDNGCGVGRHISQILSNRGPLLRYVIGVDISLGLLTNAVHRIGVFNPYVQYHLASVDNLSFIHDASVDSGIIMYRTFGNLSVRERSANLREMHRVLKTGGKYVLSLGNTAHMKTIISHYTSISGSPKFYNAKTGSVTYGDGVHQQYFTEKEIRSLVAKTQFRVQRLYEVGHGFLVWLEK